ncbi:hypothetical protein NW995_002451 [Salmonella enterica]|nr:hypothetical protein [Salmonella enterica]
MNSMVTTVWLKLLVKTETHSPVVVNPVVTLIKQHQRLHAAHGNGRKIMNKQEYVIKNIKTGLYVRAEAEYNKSTRKVEPLPIEWVEDINDASRTKHPVGLYIANPELRKTLKTGYTIDEMNTLAEDTIPVPVIVTVYEKVNHHEEHI